MKRALLFLALCVCFTSCESSLLGIYPTEWRVNGYIDNVFPVDSDSCIIDLRKALRFDFDTLYYFGCSYPMKYINEVVGQECFPVSRLLFKDDEGVKLATQDWEEMLVAVRASKKKKVRKYLLNVGFFPGPYETRPFVHQHLITNPFFIVTQYDRNQIWVPSTFKYRFTPINRDSILTNY